MRTNPSLQKENEREGGKLERDNGEEQGGTVEMNRVGQWTETRDGPKVRERERRKMDCKIGIAKKIRNNPR